MKFNIGDHIERIIDARQQGFITAIEINDSYSRYHVVWTYGGIIKDVGSKIQSQSPSFIEQNFILNKKSHRDKVLKDLLNGI